MQAHIIYWNENNFKNMGKILHLFKPKKTKKSQLSENKRLTTDFNFHYPAKEIDKKVEEAIEMGLKAKKTIKLEDGKHTGTIIGVSFVNEPYEYTEIYIKEEKTELEIRCGLPTNITDTSNLGIVMSNFGEDINKAADDEKEYTEEEIEKLFDGKNVQFTVVNKKTDNGIFAKVMPTSLKPINSK